MAVAHNVTVVPTDSNLADSLAGDSGLPWTASSMGVAREPNLTGSLAVESEAPWTAASILQSLFVFMVAALFEIGGGWCVWQAIKEGRPSWYIPIGCALLAIYGFIPTLQPPSPSAAFGRTFAAYGGIFILLSFVWGSVVDEMPLDKGDIIGGAIALTGVLIVWLWPR